MKPDEQLTRWMRLWGTDVLRMCRADLGDPQLAEDAAQETFFKAWRHAGRFRPVSEAHERAWLIRIAMNVCRDFRRCAWWRHEDRRTAPEDLPPGLLAVSDEDRDLVLMVEALPEKLRRPVLLHHLTGLGLAETAGILGISRPTLNKRLKEAYRLLAVEWREEEET